MNEKQRLDTYYDTEFAKQIAQIVDNPQTLDTKEKLVGLWKLALAERNRNKEIQEQIATAASRHVGIVEYENTEDDPCQAVVLQLLLMDHMDKGYGEEADKEWDKLARMLDKL